MQMCHQWSRWKLLVKDVILKNKDVNIEQKINSLVTTYEKWKDSKKKKLCKFFSFLLKKNIDRNKYLTNSLLLCRLISSIGYAVGNDSFLNNLHSNVQTSLLCKVIYNVHLCFVFLSNLLSRFFFQRPIYLPACFQNAVDSSDA